MKKVLLIIPAYNEEKNILKTCTKIKEYNEKNHTNYDIIVINDGSTDKTRQILEENNIPHINLIHNLGIGGGVQTGYKYAYYHNYDIAVQYDGDGQHDVRYVENIIKPIIDNEADMVMKFATHKKIYDTTSGFRACSKEIIYDFSLSYPSEYPEPITTAEIIKKKYRVKEVPVEMKEREGGVSSIRHWKNVYYMLNVCLALLAIKIRRYKRCQEI